MTTTGRKHEDWFYVWNGDRWMMMREAGTNDEPSPWGLLKKIITHCFWHWRRGNGWEA